MNRLIIEGIAGVLLLAAVSWWWHSHNVAQQEKGAQACLEAQQVQAATDKVQGEQAVKDALVSAALAAAEAAKIQKEKAENEINNSKRNAEAAHAKALDLQRRYENQLVTSSTCAAWSQQVVACDLK